MKVALVHDLLTQYGGAERVLDALIEIFPDAPIYTLVYDKEKMEKFYSKCDIRTSFLQKLPFGVKKFKWFLALMPWATETLDLSGYDLVLSDASAFAKGVITKSPTIHLCYLHTPTRYLWSDREEYIKTAPIPSIIRPLMPLIIKFLQKWDIKAGKRPNYYITNSQNVARRLEKYYHRTPDKVLWPPINIKEIDMPKKVQNYFLIVSRLEPYKRVEIVIEAFNKLGIPLKIVGSGTKFKELKQLATSPKIEFLGRVSDEELINLYKNCLAMIVPQEEDAGITMLEPMAYGRPVIAYKAGGALEVVKPGVTGMFFDEQNPESIIKVVKSFDESEFSSNKILQFARGFDKEVFKKEIKSFIEKIMIKKNKSQISNY